ncbi:MAG TPA: hypothetical protein VIK74_05930 [Parasegetibacter sp.]
MKYTKYLFLLLLFLIVLNGFPNKSGENSSVLNSTTGLNRENQTNYGVLRGNLDTVWIEVIKEMAGSGMQPNYHRKGNFIISLL